MSPSIAFCSPAASAAHGFRFRAVRPHRPNARWSRQIKDLRGEAATAGCSSSGTISASAVPTPRTAFSTSASFQAVLEHGWAAPSANELGMTCTPNLPSTICNESWDFTPPSRRGDADTRRASKRFDVRRVQRPGAAEPSSGESIANSKDEPVFSIPALSSSSGDTTYPVPSTRSLLGSKR